MKTLRILGLILAANIISVALCACGDDDESTSVPIDPKAKHITRYYYKGGNGKFEEIIYSYDSQGRVTHMDVQYDLYDTWMHHDNYSFTYGDNTITVYFTGLNSNPRTYIYSLTNGRITNLRKKREKMDDSVTSYSYNEQGYLKTADGVNYTWEGGYLTTAESRIIIYKEEYISTYKYEYSNYKMPANFIPFNLFNDNLMRVLAMQGFFGKLPPCLIINTTYYDSDNKPSTTSFTYEMHEGRPVKINSDTIIDWE